MSLLHPLYHYLKIKLFGVLRFVWKRSFCAKFLAFLLFFNSTATCWAQLVPGESGASYPQIGAYFYHQDVLGSTILLTDTEGEQVAKLYYTPYGEIDKDHSVGLDIFREKFTGQELDNDTSLYYLKERFYDPQLGLFITPEDDQEFFNPYLYAGNDPESVVDQEGNAYGSRAIKSVVKIIRRTISAATTGAGIYLWGAGINGSYNPGAWDWSLGGGTYAALFVGAVFGVASGGLGAKSLKYTTLQAILTDVAFGAAENAAFTAMAGGSPKEIASAVFTGGLIGGAVGAAGKALTKGNVGAGAGGKSAAGAEAVAAKPGDNTGDIGTDTCSLAGSSSFVAGTLVAAQGKLVPIENIRSGEYVWAYNETTAKPELSLVTGTISRLSTEFIAITVNNKMVQSTFEHPFWVEGKQWVKAKDLKLGDKVQDIHKKTFEVTHLQPLSQIAPVYNLTIENLHNYYVGNDKILVHNVRCSKTQRLANEAHEIYDPAMGRSYRTVTFAATKVIKNGRVHYLITRSGGSFSAIKQATLEAKYPNERFLFGAGKPGMHAERAAGRYKDTNPGVRLIEIEISPNRRGTCVHCTSEIRRLQRIDAGLTTTALPSGINYGPRWVRN